MRLIRYVVAVALLGCGVASAQTVDVPAEMKKLERKWVLAHAHYTPSKATADVARILTNLGRRVEIRDGRLSASDSDKSDNYLLVDFDPTANPKTVDLRVPSKKDQVLLGIYRLDDDVLSLAVATQNVRPDSFRGPEDQIVLIFKRARN
jgi:uncharacterized protein (TIGR03067 family)